MDILPIQASAVPCERVFSSSKETMTARRNRISPELMESLQLLKHSIQQGRGLNFTDGLGWVQELQELEIHEDERIQIPEDINSFIQCLASETR
jgi:hAT family C-terminal dimerisation region